MGGRVDLIIRGTTSLQNVNRTSTAPSTNYVSHPPEFVQSTSVMAVREQKRLNFRNWSFVNLEDERNFSTFYNTETSKNCLAQKSSNIRREK